MYLVSSATHTLSLISAFLIFFKIIPVEQSKVFSGDFYYYFYFGTPFSFDFPCAVAYLFLLLLPLHLGRIILLFYFL
jgi:hypothetical protein